MGIAMMADKRYRYDIRCSVCGRFVKWEECDSAVPYGSWYDIDEPDEELYCQKCVEQFKEEAISDGYLLNCFYRPPKFYYEVAEIIGWELRENGRWYKKES